MMNGMITTGNPLRLCNGTLVQAICRYSGLISHTRHPKTKERILVSFIMPPFSMEPSGKQRWRQRCGNWNLPYSKPNISQCLHCTALPKIVSRDILISSFIAPEYLSDGDSLIPLIKNFKVVQPQCIFYGHPFELIPDRLILVAAAWCHRLGRQYVTGLGYMTNNGRKRQCIGVYLDILRSDGREKTKWNTRVVFLEDEKHFIELSAYNCPTTYTIENPLPDTSDLYLGHIIEKFRAFLVKSHVGADLFNQVERIVKEKNIQWVEEVKPKVKVTKAPVEPPAAPGSLKARVMERRLSKAKMRQHNRAFYAV